MKEDKEEKFIDLTFIVNGSEVIIKKVNIHEPLKVPVDKALKQSGNTGRSITDWQIKWNDIDLDITKKTEEFTFSSDAKLFVSLKAGVGGE
jgi:hypothetical protein